MKTFRLILIKTTRYGEDGYPIQWRWSVSPSLGLSVLNALALDCARRRVLGSDVKIVVEAYEDQTGLPPMEKIIHRVKQTDGGGLVGFVSVQSAQFPRAADLARQLRSANVPVIIGGFHVSGSMIMLPRPPAELQEMLDIGVSLFVGEAEGRLEQVICDAHQGRLRPLYDFSGQLVDMAQTTLPARLPENVEKHVARFLDPTTPIEAGRGCPRKCSFCTVVNVHGRIPRCRSPKAVADYIRGSIGRHRTRFLITDDNFSLNPKWRQILEALIHLREKEGLNFTFMIQVDARSHKIPGFIDMAARAGCTQIFVGLESINPDALASVGKEHNYIEDYQQFCLAWKKKGTVIMAGYILGFPNDTPERIRQDVAVIKEKLAVDLLYPSILTPLPGSEDHAALVQEGVPLEPDLNRYTIFYATMPHPNMSKEQLEALYRETIQCFFDDDHSLRILKRHAAFDGDMEQLVPFLVIARNAFTIEKVNLAENGFIRMKSRLERRPNMPVEPVVSFMIRRVRETAFSQFAWVRQWIRYTAMARRAQRRPAGKDDPALREA